MKVLTLFLLKVFTYFYTGNCIFSKTYRVVSNRLTQLRRPLQLALCQSRYIVLRCLPGFLALKGVHLLQLLPLLKGSHLRGVLYDSLWCPLHCLAVLLYAPNDRLLEFHHFGIIPKIQVIDELILLNAGYGLFHVSTILVFKNL